MNRTQLFLFSLISFGTIAGNGFCSPPAKANSASGTYSYCNAPPDWLGQNTQIELDINQRINYERSKQGLPPLRLNAELNQAAQRHAINMGCEGLMAHQLDGLDAGQRISQTGYTWSAWEENIAAGYTTASAVVAGWMGSPGHRANILDESSLDVSETGIGAFVAPDGRMYFCQDFARPSAR